MIFRETPHIYEEDGVRYMSVTTMLHNFQEYTDWDEACRTKAKKLGTTFEALKKQWDDSRDRAATRGTIFHKIKEDEYNANGAVINDIVYPVKFTPTIDDVKEDKDMKLENNHVYTEKMIWSKKYKVCGTADLVEVIDGKINIKDYKTNTELKTSSYVHRYLGSKKLKWPVNALDDCNFNTYSLQINLYMYMLLQQNRHLKMGEMTILHIGFDDDDKPVSMMPYLVKNYQTEVKLMLEECAQNQLP